MDVIVTLSINLSQCCFQFLHENEALTKFIFVKNGFKEKSYFDNFKNV